MVYLPMTPRRALSVALTQTIVGAGHAKQVALRIGHPVLYVHLNAHDVLIGSQHHTRCGQLTNRLDVHRLHIIDKGWLPVQTWLNQMAELAKSVSPHHVPLP